MKEVKPAALKVKEAARYLNLSESTVRKMSDTGELPCFKLGRARYFPLDALNAWMKSLPKWAESDGQNP